jgi:RNA polymerase sigma-70 factor (sigma-E family)
LSGRPRGAERDDDFVGFVAAAQSRLLNIAYLTCGDRHRAEDIVQSALVNLYVHWAWVDRDLGAWAYARRAVINAAIDDGRRPWRRETATDAVPDRVGAPSVAFDEDLLTALRELPRRQRAVVVLRYVEDLDVDTVASLLGISTGTVKSQAARGLDTLRDRLGASTGSARLGRK